MKKIPAIIFKHTIAMQWAMALTSASLLLQGCSLNTRLDDTHYRSLGAQAAPQQAAGINEKDLAFIENAGIKGANKISALIPANKTTASHAVRYGHAQLIRKIVKTAQIHCQKFETIVHSQAGHYWGQQDQPMAQCIYRFPNHCGGHQFTVLDYGNKQSLVFTPSNNPYHLIDLLTGSPAARPGLWDQDDRVASKANNIRLTMGNDYNAVTTVNPEINKSANQPLQPLQLGWIIQTSIDEEAQLGQLYHQAIIDISSCF